MDVIRFHSCIFELCISTVHTPTCTGDAGPEQSLVLLSYMFKGCFSFSFQGAVCVEALDFEGNFMGGEGGVYFGDVLNKNTFLTDIVSVF